MNRGQFTSSVLAQVYEKEGITETMRQHAAALVLNVTLHQVKIEDIEATTEETYWKSLKTNADKFGSRGLFPILLLDSPAKPEWVSNWESSQYNKKISIPSGLTVSYNEDKNGESYICNFNNIEVFSASLPSGKSYLLVRELFEELIVTDFGGGKCLIPKLNPNSEDKVLVDLELIYSIKVINSDYPIFCLNYHSKK